MLQLPSTRPNRDTQTTLITLSPPVSVSSGRAPQVTTLIAINPFVMATTIRALTIASPEEEVLVAAEEVKIEAKTEVKIEANTEARIEANTEARAEVEGASKVITTLAETTTTMKRRVL